MIFRGAPILASIAALLAAPGAPQRSADELLAHAREVFFQQGARTVLPDFERAMALYQKAGNRRGEAIALGYIGYSYYDLGDLPKALARLQQSLKMKHALGDRQEEGKTLGHLGLVHWAMGNYDQSIQEHTASLAIARQLGDRRMEGAALNNLGLVHDELGDYQRSLQEYQQALELHRATEFVRGQTDALGDIGGVYLLLGRYRDALPYYQQALALDEQENLKPSITRDLGNIGLCHAALGQGQEALATFDRALAVARETGLKKEEADWQRGKGTALVRMGRYDAALTEYRLALKVYEETGLQRELVEGLQDLGDVHLLLGDAASAETGFRRALELAQKIRHPRGVTTSLIALGDLEWRRQRFPQAAALYEDALLRARQSENREQTIASLVQLSLTYKELGRVREAQQRSGEAREMARAYRSRVLEAQALHALAAAERAGGQAAAALGHISTGSEIAQATGDPELVWRLGYAQGQTLEDLNRPREAVRAYEKAAAVIESVRSQLREDRFRSGYLEDKYQVFVALVRLLLKLGRAEEAFGFAEKLRAQSFSALLGNSAPRAHSEAERDLRVRIRDLQRSLDQENAKAPAERRAQKSETFSGELAKAEREYQNLLDDLRGTDPDYAAARALAIPPINAIRNQFPAGVALVEFITASDLTAIFVLTNRRLEAMTVPAGAAALSAKVGLLRDLIPKANDDWRKPAESLRRILIDPIENAGWLDNISTVYLVPHGALNYLPFDVLPNGGRYLIEDYALAYLPAAAAIVRREQPEVLHSLLAVAPARTHLPNSQEEARSIGDFFPQPSRILVGANATESSFKREAGGYGTLHLATHGYFNKTNPLFSAVELEPDQTEDGRLEVHEILDMRLNAGLVTLSACDTALGSGYFAEAPAGDEFIGLTRAFLHAGSRAVLASLWAVNDRSTLELMRNFYRALPRSGRAKALAEAQRDALRNGGRYAHPYYWAPFVLVGEMK